MLIGYEIFLLGQYCNYEYFIKFVYIYICMYAKNHFHYSCFPKWIKCLKMKNKIDVYLVSLQNVKHNT